jgi:hypothetical protein
MTVCLNRGIAKGECGTHSQVESLAIAANIPNPIPKICQTLHSPPASAEVFPTLIDRLNVELSPPTART